MGDQPHQQWTRLIADVLRDHPVVGVRAAVEWHLDRPPTRSESNAAHRAAHAMADGDRVSLQQVRVRGEADARVRRYLLVGRDDLTLLDWPTQADLQVIALVYPPSVPTPREPLEKMLQSLYNAAGHLNRSLLASIDPDPAHAVADAMDAPLAELFWARKQLRRRTSM